MPSGLPKGVLRREKVESALAMFPGLRAHLPPSWTSRHGRAPELVDAHRVYRWLAAGGIGWSGEQLASMQGLVERLTSSPVGLEGKVAELFEVDDDRFDSLSTELLLADHFLSSGHTLEVEPDIGGRHPEYLVDQRLLVEAKTYCPRRDEAPLGRLRFELCHRVDSSHLIEMEVEGDLTANDVAPLVRQAAITFAPGSFRLGDLYRFERGRVALLLRATHPIGGMAEGSSVSFTPKATADEELLRRSFIPWFEGQVKTADEQMRAYPGPKVVVVDVSYCRVALDMLDLDASAVRRVLDEVQRKRSSVQILVATRFQGQQFGELRFLPRPPTEFL